MRIYTDLDNVLINPVEDAGTKQVISILPRPDVDWFLRQLSEEGELWILTAANMPHVDHALEVLGELAVPYISGVISAEDLYPVSRQIEMIFGAQGLTDAERADLVAQIPPIAPPGVVFDDWAVRSGVFYVKASAVGIGPDHWIEVEPFSIGSPDRNGLRKAHAEYRRRFGAALAGTETR